ncbi:MAG TPA: ABC transporter permease [Candidatus Dormibacteraeota bacterium]|nr:ABC transporter permease [Candidatus Dormibacteraeota bacterium]
MSAVAVVAQLPEQRTARRETLRQLSRSKTFVSGTVIIGFWIFCAVFGYRVAPHDPLAQTFPQLIGMSGAHFFGTDQLGRDVFSRVLTGARDILLIVPAATLLGIVGGTTIGLITGYFRGFVDDAISRMVDAVLALPLIVIAVTVLVALGHSTGTLIVVIGLVFTPIVSRTVRAAVLAERQLDYVSASQLCGERAPYIMFVEILPNVMGPIIVEGTVRLGYAIFAVAGLTFLGFGVQPPSPDWALQIADNYPLLGTGTYWWTVLFPALAIVSLVVAVNLVADGLAKVLER